MSLSADPPLIRPAGPSDAETLTEIHQECFANYWDINAFNDFFAVSGTLALVAETPDPIGMMVYRIQHEQAEIITLAVRPYWRRRGMARALLERAMAKAVELGAKKLFLDVEDGNKAAFSLYAAYGFTLINRRKQYYRQKDGSFTDALVMARKLGL